jgi:hypothetical protein
MKEYSLKLTASELKKYIKTKGYSTSLLPIMELSRDSYIEFLDRFISLNDWEGYNHRLLDWKNFSEYLKNTLKKSKPHSYNGVNIESFTMAANIDSIKVLDESIVVRLIRVQNTTTNVIELKTFGDLIIAAYVAFLFTHELGLSQASINIITVKSLDCPIIKGKIDSYKINVNGSSCELIVDDSRIDIMLILNNAFDYICH